VAVALNPNTPAEALTRLASDDVMGTRSIVASNKNTPVDVLIKLANDEDRWVRRGVGRNKNMPVDVLRRIAQDKTIGQDEREELEKIIRQREAANESLLRSLIRKIV
jgi:hypothetical protein